MQIRTATQADYTNVMAFYDAMNAEIGRQAFLRIQYRGGFPPDDMVVSAIDNRELFVGEEDGRIVAAYIMNSEADAVYNTVQWQIVAPKDQVCILHALRVDPAYGRRGFARRLVLHSIETATQRGKKAIRLDCLDENEAPQRMYLSLGFRYIDTVPILYEDIGEPRDFRLYELVLSNS